MEVPMPPVNCARAAAVPSPRSAYGQPGLTGGQVRRIVADIDGAADVVALTIAEFFPWQVTHLRQILSGFPLLSTTTAD
ncbi:hypothetical protein [Nonomuraea angiospora]